LQYVEYTKSINIVNEIAKHCDKNVFLGKKSKKKQPENKKSNIQTLAGAVN